ncbi:MAG: class I SAM-dependent methyltransferase [Smithellaceae bacterium]|nr:class I SAM-dependent methyltransferase [Smithellaceae bacterium]
MHHLRDPGLVSGMNGSAGNHLMGGRTFDDWPQRYDQWFETPVGRLIRDYESQLVMELLQPGAGEFILDAGCGTGVFTRDILERGASVIGLDISLSMLRRFRDKCRSYQAEGIQGDILRLPFGDGVFDKTMSITAIEFIKDGPAALAELFRVTRPGGLIVVATLNSLSPWAARRSSDVRTKGHPIFDRAVFRSPEELAACFTVPSTVKTAIHFPKDEDPARINLVEEEGRRLKTDSGAFLVASGLKPH